MGIKTLLAAAAFIFLFYSPSLGQPSLQMIENYPVDQEYEYWGVHFDELDNYQKGGSEVIWDFSDASTPRDNQVTIRSVTPSETNHEEDFPNANLAIEMESDTVEETTTRFHNNQDEEMTTEGYVAGMEGFMMVVESDEPTKNFERPVNFEDSYLEEDIERTYNFPDGELDAQGTYEFVADGYGELVLPDGRVFEDVLRVVVYEEFSGSEVFFSIEDVRKRYAWYVEEQEEPVMSIDSVTFQSNVMEDDITVLAGQYQAMEQDPPVIESPRDYDINDFASYWNVPAEEIQGFHQGGANHEWDFAEMEHSGDTTTLSIWPPQETGLSEKAEEGEEVWHFDYQDREVWELVNNQPDKVETSNMLLDESGMTTEVSYEFPIKKNEKPLRFGQDYKAEPSKTYQVEDFEGFDEIEAEGFNDYEVDAYGSLQLPDGQEYDDVLRIVTEERYEYEGDFFDMTDHWKQYAWFHEDYDFPVFRIDSVEFETPQFEVSEVFVNYLKDTGTRDFSTEITRQHQSSSDLLRTYSYQSEVYVEYPFTGDEEVHLKVFDLTGRKVADKTSIADQDNRKNFSFSRLQNGLYLFHLEISASDKNVSNSGRIRLD